MPEIGEVARVVHFIRKHLINKTITKVTANHDDIVFGKVGTSAAEFEKHITGKKIVDVGQQGKYFWMIMSSPPHPVMHLGMSGWFKIKSEHTYYYKKKAKDPDEEWPPKYVKFLLQTEGNGETEEGAFVDARRLGRIRLVHCDGKEIRKNSPLKENGPDPVIDKDAVSLEWLTEKCRKKKVPIKAMLLDQAVISGIGNWVADEVMYNAKMHPEQYANTLQDAQIKQLHKSIHYVCGLACELLAESDRFPKEWLFKYRWSKAKKSGPVLLANGSKVEFLTVGGRTSAIVPTVQKKTGPVAKDVVNDEDSGEDEEEDEKPQKAKKDRSKKRKAANEEEDDDDDEAESDHIKPVLTKPVGKKAKAEETVMDKKKSQTTKTSKSAKPGSKTPNTVKAEEELDEELISKPAAESRKAKRVKSEAIGKEEKSKNNEGHKTSRTNKVNNHAAEEESSGRRRSGRLKK